MYMYDLHITRTQTTLFPKLHLPATSNNFSVAFTSVLLIHWQLASASIVDGVHCAGPFALTHCYEHSESVISWPISDLCLLLVACARTYKGNQLATPMGKQVGSLAIAFTKYFVIEFVVRYVCLLLFVV